jgi:hypothetical protein
MPASARFARWTGTGVARPILHPLAQPHCRAHYTTASSSGLTPRLRGLSWSSPSFPPIRPPLTRAYSVLPVVERFVPRRYPFPLVLTSELLQEEDLEQQRFHPHDLPPYKSTLTVNLHDLPLTAGEKRIFRRLVGPRLSSSAFRDHPLPNFLHRPKPTWSAGKKKTANTALVRFVSRHLPSAEANENRVFQLLDESLRVSKKLAAEMEEDGEWVEMGEEEQIIADARKRMKRELWEERQKRKKKEEGDLDRQGGDAPPQLTAESAAPSEGRERESVRVRAEQPHE